MGAPALRHVTGPAASGKTAALVAHVCELVCAGVDAADVLVVAPSPDAADELRDRLERAVGSVDAASALALRVCSARSLALGALAFDGGAAGAGSFARVLAPAERSVLLADLRARGFSGAQVAAALAVACAAWEAEEEPVPREEDACLAALLAALDVRGALLEEALFARALTCVRGAGLEACPRDLGARHILLDDADLLPPAARTLCTALAGEGLWVATCGDAAGGDVALPAPSRRLGARRAFVVKWEDPAEEAAGIAAYVSQVLAAVDCPGEVLVVTPNHAGSRRIADALARAGVPVSCEAGRRILPGDPRSADASTGQRALALLGLAADPRDVASWRMWCAAGRPDLAAPAWVRLEDGARERGVSVADALGALAGPVTRGPTGIFSGRLPVERGCDASWVADLPGARTLAERVGAARRVLGACEGRRGRALLDAIDPGRTDAFRALVAADDGSAPSTEDARALYERARARIAEPRFASRARFVRVAQAQDARGLRPRVVVLAGCNEGLCDDGLVRDALARPCDELLASYVQRMPVEVAERQGARVRRTREQAGERVALLAPSPALAALEGEAPSTLSGQQFASTHLHLRP